MSRDITLTFTEEQWKSMLDSMNDSDNTFPSDGIMEVIQKALCPDGHLEAISNIPQCKYNNWAPFYVTATCERCAETLWFIRPSNWPAKEYMYINFSEGQSWETRILFLAGDENDPHKVDLLAENPLG